MTTLQARLRRWQADEQGSAVVEFVFLTIVVLIPLIYLVLTVGRVQAGTYAVTQAAADIAFADFGFTGRLGLDCDGSPCLRPEGRITTRAEVSVPLPLVPDFARAVVPLELPVSATSVATVDRFRAAP